MESDRSPEPGAPTPPACTWPAPDGGASGLAGPPVVPAGVAARLAALGEVVLCSGFPTQLLIAQVLTLAGLSPFTHDRSYSATFVFTLSLADAVVLVGLVVWLLRRQGESPRRVLLGWRPVVREGVLGLLLVPAVFVLAVGVLILAHLLAPWLHNVADNPLEALLESPAHAAVFALVAVVSGGVREEVQRAFILHRFEQHLGGALVGLVAFSAIFGAGHLIQGWDAALATGVLGAFWGCVYLVRRSIAAPLVSHAGFDLAEIIRYTLYGL